MYGYMQSTSPYQQNIDIIRGFFMKPIVLLATIFSILTLSLSFFTGLSNNLIAVNSTNQINSITSGGTSLLSLTFSMITAIFWIMLYKSSKSDKHQHKATTAVKGLYVCSVIALIMTILITFTVILGGVISLYFIYTVGKISFLLDINPNFTSLFSKFNGLSLVAMTTVLVILIIAVIFLFLYSLTNLLFINSVKKSMTSIFLKKTGATAYGVLNIIFAVFGIISLITNLYSTLIITKGFSLTIPYILSTLSILCFSVGCLLTGILAIQYSGYINKYINGQTFKHQYKATASQKPYVPPVQNDYYTPVANENPYPQATLSTNEYPFTNQPVNPQPVNNNAYVRVENYNIQTVDDFNSTSTPQQPKNERHTINETDSYLF